MKKMKAMIAVLILTLGEVGLAPAQNKKPALPTPPPIPANAAPKLEKLKGGTVVSVNAVAGVVTIQTKDGTQTSCTVAKTTRLHRNRKPAKLSEISVGDHVMLARFNPATKEAGQLELFSSSGNNSIPTPAAPAGK